jgi:hypothetical protein
MSAFLPRNSATHSERECVMSIFDFLNADKRQANKLERAIKGANNKFKPKDYRQVALNEVITAARARNPVAIQGLLARFAVCAEPSSEDEQEKEWVCETLVEIGADGIDQLRRALRTAESVTWVHRVLRSVLSEEEYKKELLEVLDDFDTEYERNPDRKLQTIMALSETPSAEVTTALLRFLEDVDETVRYQTVAALVKHRDENAREPLLEALCSDESIRVRNIIINAFAELEWLTTGYKKKVEALLPSGYKQDKNGKIVKLGGGS